MRRLPLWVATSSSSSSTTTARAERVIFLHIPKTAGMSLRGLLAKNYRGQPHFNTDNTALLGNWQTYQDNLRHTAPEELARYRVFKGHMRFGLHEALPFPCRYITFLRKPRERIVSHYRMIRRLGDLPADHKIDLSRPDWNLSAWPSYALFWDNCQTRILAGAGGDLPFGQCTAEHLRVAKANLDRHFQFVGLTEEFDLSLLLLERLCGWQWRFYISDNVAPDRAICFCPEVNQAIDELNRWDRELYEHARKRFQLLVNYYGLHLRLEHRLFTFGNRVHKGLHVVRHRLKQRLGVEKRVSQFLPPQAAPSR